MSCQNADYAIKMIKKIEQRLGNLEKLVKKLQLAVNNIDDRTIGDATFGPLPDNVDDW